MSNDEPIDQTLCGLTLAAVHGAGAAADAYLQIARWRPRVNLPKVGSYDSGWPQLSVPFMAPESAAVSYKELFAAEKRELKPLAFGEIEELRALLDYARGSEVLRSRLHPFPGREDEMVEWIIEIQVADLPLSILDRAQATGVTTDKDLLALYLQRERAWLLDPLPVEYVIPLALTALDLDEPLAIDATRGSSPSTARSRQPAPPIRT